MNQPTDKPSLTGADWFEMTDLRRRRFATTVWVPLRSSETTTFSGSFGKLGHKEEVLALGCVGVPLDHRSEAEKLDWMDIGLHNEGRPHAFEDGRYKRAEVYQYRDGEDLATNFVLDQGFDGNHERIWHVNQDLVLALGLLQEGDRWTKPDEGFVEVMRQRRNADGKVTAIEIKNEFLRDYLAARGMALRLYYYRRRMEVMPDISHIPWVQKGIKDNQPHDRFEARSWAVDEAGDVHGAGVAVFQAWRTDVDNSEDVPVFGPATDSNSAGRSMRFAREGKKFHRVEGELWRAEWIEPASRSERVRGDSPEQQASYVVDAGGRRELADKLNDEDIGMYLWFKPQVITALTQVRGGGLKWYTRQTGGVWCSSSSVHFGINDAGLINVYAYDVARLPSWQQRIWAGHNVSPEGPPSTELLDAQMRTSPAKTKAPEQMLGRAMDALDKALLVRTGAKLFKPHDSTDSISATIHRFRACDDAGLLALAKDIARLVADRIEVGPLRKLAMPPKEEKWGSLKSLEKALATITSPDEARKMMSPLFGIYELRLGDAHLPSSEIEAAFGKLGIDRTAIHITQGEQLIAAAVSTLQAANAMMVKSPV